MVFRVFRVNYSTAPSSKAYRKRVPVDLSSVTPPSKSYKASPKNESRLHFVTKNHICEQLNAIKQLSIYKSCLTKQHPEMPSLSLWTCTNVLEMRDWLVGWDHAKMEHSIRGVGKFDIALLRRESTDKKAPASLADLAGVVEIIYKSPMKDEKVKQLNEAKVPWIEVEAKASLWLHSSRWTPEQAIPTFRTSEPAWTCHVCATGQQGIRLKRIMSIVDIFPSSSTKNQYGCIQRKIYSLFQRDSQYFLVEGNYIVITGWLQWYQINKEALLVSTTLDQLDQPANSTESDALAYLRGSYEDILRKIYEENDPDAIVHPVIKWPGISIPELETRDELRHLVNYSTINSIPDLYGTIARLFGHAFTWDRRRHSWMRNPNHAAPAAPTQPHHDPTL